MALLYVGAAFAAGAQLAPKHFRYPLYILGLLILGAVMIWEGWYIRGHLLPGMTGVFLLGVAAFVGAVVRLVPNAPDQLRPDTSEDIAIAATLVARRFPPRFIRGGLSLEGPRLRFVGLDETVHLDAHLRDVKDVKFTPLVGGQVRFTHQGKRFRINLGRSHDLDQIRETTDYWREAIRHRRRPFHPNER